MGREEAQGPLFSRNLQQEPQVLEISVLDVQCFLLARAQPEHCHLTAQLLHGLPELLWQVVLWSKLSFLLWVGSWGGEECTAVDSVSGTWSLSAYCAYII